MCAISHSLTSCSIFVFVVQNSLSLVVTPLFIIWNYPINGGHSWSNSPHVSNLHLPQTASDCEQD